MKALLAAATVGALAMGVSHAATISYTEGSRTQEPGSVKIGDVPANPAGRDIDFMIGDDLGPDDVIQVFGRIVSSEDTYNFTALQAFDFRLIEAPLGTSGITDTNGPSPHQIDFKFTNTDTNLITTITVDTSDPVGTYGTLLAGSYILELDMEPDNQKRVALYDFELASVPIPGALPLFAAGLAGLGLRRRRKA